MKTIVVVFCVLVTAVIAGPVKNFYSKAHIDGRITGGAAAAPHQFPYQAGLLTENQDPDGYHGTYWCGGSLISNKVVLTAAHCFNGFEEGTVILGSQYSMQENVGVHQKISNKDVIIHPEFDDKRFINDIALIILPYEVELNESIKTVNLPRPDQVESTLEGKVAVITGWGLLGDFDDQSYDNLEYANVRILPAAPCQKAYPNFLPTEICVSGDNHKSVCAGDSGGPLVISEPDGSNTVVGVVSYEKMKGCELGYPTVFTRVTSYLDWIAKTAGVVPK